MSLPEMRKPERGTRLCRLLLALMVAGATTIAAAQERGHPQPGAQPSEPHAGEPRGGQRGSGERGGEPRESVLRLLPPDSVTEHSVDTPDGKLAYTATAGTLSLLDQSGERSAAIFYTAYVAKSLGSENRPVTFAFNGGPGAASAFLNLGLVGPKSAEFPHADPAAARLVDNPQTWLAFTDLVLIDPVGSGWSRPAKPDGGKAFWSVDGDAQAMAKSIMLYVTGNGRMSSPKYLLGESYGGFRAAKVARELQTHQGTAVSGIIMLSPLIEGGLLFGGSRFALGAALRLPSLGAAELERKGSFSTQALAEIEHFALTEYLTKLAAAPPQGEAARDFYAQVARITGLPEDVVARSRGFVRDAYRKHLRSAEGKVVSAYDASFAVPDPFPEQETARGPDPLLDGLARAYGGLFSSYARDELGFKTQMTYTLLASDIAGKWDWGRGGRAAAGVSDDLRELLSLIPSFRLLIAHGYSDMVTPYAMTRYVLDHLPPIGDPSRARLVLHRGGHMFYIDPQSRKSFSAEARAFYQSPTQ
ncbi:MAG TPA: carboxypeptidase [Xanthobacteraceae bacterium]